MDDAHDGDLLSPSTSHSAQRATYVLQRDRDHCARASGSERLTVVYDRIFDRFFLREEQLRPPVLAKSPPSLRPQQPFIGSKTAKRRSTAAVAGVRWEDLVLPPKSVAKRTSSTCGTGQSVDADQAGSVGQMAEDTVQGSHGGDDVAAGVTKAGTTVEAAEPARSSVQDHTEDMVEPTASEATHTLDDSTEGPVDAVEEQLAVDNKSDSLLENKTATPLTLSKAADPTEDSPGFGAQAPTDRAAARDDSQMAESTGQVDPAPATETTNDCTAVAPIATSQLQLAVVLLRAMRRFVRKRQASANPEVAGHGAASLVNTDQQTRTDPVGSMVPSTSEPTVACGPTQPPEEQLLVQPSAADASNILLALRLDLTKLPQRQLYSQLQPRSPLRKSPKKKTRVANYDQHFAAAAVAATAASESVAGAALVSCLHVDKQDDSAIRWQGDVVKVAVTISTTDNQDGPSSHYPALWKRPDTAHRSTARDSMGHMYSLKELARIRPHADGFRRVNQDCTFVALTSSESSSESEQEQVAVVQLASSSDEEIDGVVFKRGDKVLFHARDRWFKGTVLRQIKQSWFYDIRAANGSVFEAIQAKRIRLFDGDDEPAYTFEEGDRVLWQPNEDMTRKGKNQSYKARVLLIRKPSARGAPRGATHEQKRYDLELLTGRVVKRVLHADLRPYHR